MSSVESLAPWGCKFLLADSGRPDFFIGHVFAVHAAEVPNVTKNRP